MAEPLMDRSSRISAALAAGSADAIPLADLRAEVSWRQAAQLIPTDALDAKTAERAVLLAAIQGREIPAPSQPQAEAAAPADPPTRSRK